MLANEVRCARIGRIEVTENRQPVDARLDDFVAKLNEPFKQVVSPDRRLQLGVWGRSRRIINAHKPNRHLTSLLAVVQTNRAYTLYLTISARSGGVEKPDARHFKEGVNPAAGKALQEGINSAAGKSRLLRQLRRPATFAGILEAFSGSRDDFFFVQIGAYDGRTSDPIEALVHGRHWRGILVEPQPDAFERLKRNYAHSPGLIFENVAIADHEGSHPLYMLKDEFAHLAKGDYRMLSSFYPEHVTKHLTKQVDAREALQSIQVRCLTLSGLLAKYGIHSLDLLQIDAEGYDYQILKMVDFRKIKPRIIRFEHVHLSAAEKGECLQLLVSHDYKVVTGGYDVTAFQSDWMYA